ncbi:MAG: tetratricopeptide repeat protein [Deltaproteobacteria bacterium]|nr:tetratricopeptide repeat protein [Deltaproteobacteria bacterium]
MNHAERARRAAQRGRAALKALQTRDAAWLGLYALEQDETCPLAWALVAHILTEATRDPAATWVTHRALADGLEEPHRTEIARYHLVDLWTRGLMAHASGKALVTGAQVSDEAAFRPTARLEPWLAEQAASWGGDAGVLRAVQRMVAALADAWDVPQAEDPLRADVPWPKKPLFEQWCDKDPLAVPANDEAPEAAVSITADIQVISDYWMQQEIDDLIAGGRAEEALTLAQRWAELRQAVLPPKVALVQAYAARGDDAARDEVALGLAHVENTDLEELEDARIALGALELWVPQLGVLDRMLALAPDHPIILANRGIAKLKLDDVAGAREDLQLALQNDPENPAALANLGLVEMRAEEYPTARQLLERARAAAPEEPDILVYLAVCKNNQGLGEAAKDDLRAALALAPGHARAKALLEELS